MGKHVLDTGWLAARSTEVALTGVELTTSHPPAAAAAPWMHAAVPGTYVLLLAADFPPQIVPTAASDCPESWGSVLLRSNLSAVWGLVLA